MQRDLADILLFFFYIQLKTIITLEEVDTLFCFLKEEAL